jgi:uncharacterized repeat protein (TIGR01451 family)
LGIKDEEGLAQSRKGAERREVYLKSIMKLSREYFLRVFRSCIFLFTTFSYQCLVLLVEANTFPVSAQVQSSLCATPGNDGIGNNLSGIINTYYPGAANTIVNPGSTSISVGAINSNGSTTPIAAGDLLLVIQMQGADIDSDINNDNNGGYGDGTAGDGNNANTLLPPTSNVAASGNLNNANFIAGNYEYVVATGAISGGTISIRGAGTSSGLINSYSNAPFGTQGQRTYQVIRVPQYSSATLSSSLTAPRWDGSSGGIVVSDIAGNLNLGGATVDVSGRGFRGGGARDLDGNAPALLNTDYRTASTDTANGSKGEGTAGTPRFLIDRANNTLIDNGSANEGYPNGSYGRGAPGNAGGGSTDGNPANSGGNDENSGGGGGGNGSTGGLGGRSFRSQLYIGGFGGAAFSPASTNRLVMGGGGGAGTTNNGTSDSPGIVGALASSGAPGGGMVFMRTASVAGSGTINANGATAFNVLQDGGGGGGAGGSVVVTALNNNLTGLTVDASGGKGGDARFVSFHGPGGGGGGGVVFTSSGAIVKADGGVNGGTGDPIDSTNSYGATPGNARIVSPPGNIPGIRSGAECIPQLTVNKVTTTPGPISQPGKAIYSITVTNASDRATAKNINITDPLPSGFSFDGSVTPTITLNAGATATSTTNPNTGDTSLNFGSFDIPGGGSVQISFSTDIAATVADGTYQNSATATYIDPTRTVANGTVSSSYDSASSTGEDVTVGTVPPPPPPLPPANISLRGIKRITNVTRNGIPIPGVNFSQVIDDSNDPNDDRSIWSNSAITPIGVIQIDPQLLIKAGDEVEYTIYFLVDGNQSIPNVRLCDPIPLGTNFISDAFGAGNGIALNLANTITSQTNSSDADKGSYFSPVTPLPANNVCPNQGNPTGAVLINFGTLDYTPGNNVGFVRFRVRLE